MNVSLQDVKRLRVQTGAGMGDCKKALVAAAGDFDEAEKFLKKQGLANAAQRCDRQTSEGAVFSAENDERLVLVEIRCETDFVAMNEEFRKLGMAVARQALEQNLYSADAALTSKVQEGVLSLKENLKIGEIANMQIAAGDTVATYSHNNGAIVAAVILHCDGGDSAEIKTQALQKLGRELAMHAAAYQPIFLDSSKVAASLLAEQEEIFRERAQKEGIPEKAREGYLRGQLKKWLAACSFMDQGFVKEPKSSVDKVLQDFSKQHGSSVTLGDYRIIKVSAAS